MSTSALLDQLHMMGACSQARSWVSQAACDSIETAWTTCPDVTWLFWLLCAIHPEWAQISREFIERLYYPKLTASEQERIRALLDKYGSTVVAYDRRDATEPRDVSIPFDGARRSVLVRYDSLFRGGPDTAGSIIRIGQLSEGHADELAIIRDIVPVAEIAKYWAAVYPDGLP